MSKKRRHSNNAAVRRLPVVKQPGNPKILQILPLIARDGYMNTLAHLGEASDLGAANTFQRNSISRDYEQLTVMYRENWIAKRIIDTPCEDMTRSWYRLSSNIDQDKLDELEKLEARHSVKQEITNGLRWARLYGGAAAVMVIKGQEDMLDQPLDYDDLMPGCFRGLIVVDRTNGLDPSVELEDDMDDVEFGYPKYYTVQLNDTNNSMVRVHHSRLLVFRGRMLPIVEEMTESYWGASELEHVYEELQKRNSTSANIAQLIFQANVGALKMADYGEIMGMGTEQQKQQILEAIYAENRIRNSFGMMIMSNEDSFEQHAYSFSGLSEVYETFMMDMAGAAEIPATKLYGRAPQGMNATGESDMNNYYDMLAQLQERHLRPAIEKLLPVMAMSLWGEIPEDMKVIFEPMQTTTPAERAQIMQQVTGVVIQAYSAGLIAQQPALVELQKFGKDIGFWESITDEMVEKAETEIDNGEGMEDPMAAMGGEGGMPGMGGMMPPGIPGGPEQAAEDPEQPPEAMSKPEAGKSPEKAAPKPEEQPKKEPENGAEKPQEAHGEPSDKAVNKELAEILKSAKGQMQAKEEDADDGGPGSGNFGHPGYKRGGGAAPEKASIGERMRFLQDPTEGKNAPRSANGPTGSKSHVEKMNRERKQWGNLTLHQKIKGNAEQQKHIAKMKADVVEAAMKGDLGKAREIVKANRHYWSNDPDSAQKVQSETLKRQKAVKPRRMFLHDALVSLLKIFGRDSNEEVQDEEIWRTNEEGNHFKLESTTGEIKGGFGGKYNGKKIGEEWEPGAKHKTRKSGSKVAAPPKAAPKPKNSAKIDLTFNVTSTGHRKSKEFADETRQRYEESLSEAKSVFSNPNSTEEQKDESLTYLLSMSANSDQWKQAEHGDAPSTEDFGLGKMPRDWADRLTSAEQDVLSKICEETDGLNYIESSGWRRKNEEASNVQLALQAKLLGADIDVKIPDDLLQKYAGVENRTEVPGQQSMFYGENVPMREGSAPAYNSKAPVQEKTGAIKEPVDTGYKTNYNESGSSQYYTGEHWEGHKFPPLKGGTEFSSAKPETFRDAIVEAQNSYSDADGWRVGPHDEYSESDKCFVSPAGSTTCVAENGDIVSVCKRSGSSDRASDLLQQAIANGGNKLDAYGIGLFRLYTSNGFEPCSWCEWNDEFAPEKWKSANGLPDDNSWHGRPDSELVIPREPIVFYRLTGNKAKYGSEAELREAYEGFLKRTKSTGMDYDAAYEQRDKMMGG